MDVKPAIYDGMTFLPARYLVEGIGGKVSWDNQEKIVECKTDKHTLKLWVEKTSAELDGVEVSIGKNLNIKPRIVNGRVLVPFRFLGESLGCEVEWDGAERRIDIKF
jgi:hypothetical protein